MPLNPRRLHPRLAHLTLITGILLAVSGLLIASVGIPTFGSPEGMSTRDLTLNRLPLGVLAALFGAAEAWAVHRGALRLAWLPALGLIAFGIGVYPSAGHLVAPLVVLNVLALAALQSLDRWLVRA